MVSGSGRVCGDHGFRHKPEEVLRHIANVSAEVGEEHIDEAHGQTRRASRCLASADELCDIVENDITVNAVL